MIVYHGSYTAIDEIDIELCEAGKDFGRGFYVTKLAKQAEAWATRKGKINRTKGAVTENDDEQQQAHDYDIVEGPVANDRIATQIDDYLNGSIGKEQFLKDLVRNPSHQMCFCTVQSLQTLSLAKGKIDSTIYHIDSDILQALMTDYGMNELDATDRYYTSQTYSQLADEVTRFYLKSWQEIYEILKQELSL